MTDRRASPVMRAGLLSRLEQAGAILDVDGPPAWATSDVIWVARLLEVTPMLIDHGLRRGDELWLLDRRLAPLDVRVRAVGERCAEGGTNSSPRQTSFRAWRLP